MSYFKINNYIFKTTKIQKTVLNLKKEKKPFLLIINLLLIRTKSMKSINSKNNFKVKCSIYQPIFLPFYLKHAYFKKKIKFI